MRKLTKLLTLITALALAFALTVPAAAASGSKNVSITYRGISITLNGGEVVPKDANGKAVEPFIMSGTTYLPVRAVAGALGMNVEWDSASSTVILTSGGQADAGSGKAVATSATKSAAITYRDIKITLDGKALTPKDANGKAVEPFIMSGTTYLPVRAVANALGIPVDWDAASSTVILGERLPQTAWALASSKAYTSSGALDGEWGYTYDASGNCLTSFYKSNGNTFSEKYSYNAAGSLVKEVVTDPSGTVTYEYDAAGQTTRMTDKDGSVYAYAYDSHGNIISETATEGGVTTVCKYDYTYYANGLVKSYHYNYDGQETTVSYTYDSHENVTQMRAVTLTACCSYDYSAYSAYTYDGAGNILTEKDWDSEGGLSKFDYYARTYDKSSTMLTEEYYYSDSGVKSDYYKDVYTYDQNGNMLSYSYDGYTETYTYDADGNCLTENYNGVKYTNTYDENGNLLKYVCSDGSYTVNTYVSFTK